MATEPHTQRGIREERARRADGGQPLNDESRRVHYSGHSLVIGLTDFGVKTHDLTDESECIVEVYPDGIWIDTEVADE